MVLEFGWAYGPEGTALQDKTCLNVITTGGAREIYCNNGSNNFSINEFLRPFEQTANLCGMNYLPPFAVMGTHLLTSSELKEHAVQYDKLIDLLQAGIQLTEFKTCAFLNDVPQLITQ